MRLSTRAMANERVNSWLHWRLRSSAPRKRWKDTGSRHFTPESFRELQTLHPRTREGGIAPERCFMPARSLPARYLVRLKSIHKTALVCLFLVPLCAASDWNYEETHSDAHEFVAGGFVHVRLGVGDMHIRRGDANKISLRYTVKSRHER